MQSKPVVHTSAAGPGSKDILPTRQASSGGDRLTGSVRVRLTGSVLYLAILTLIFIVPLAHLMVYASGNSLHSHIPLIPVIVAYLLYIQGDSRARGYGTSLRGAVLLATLGLASIGVRVYLADRLSENDSLACLTFAYVTLIGAGGFLFLGSRWMAAAAFPMAFLLFIIPLPDVAAVWLEQGLVVASADASAMLFRLTGTPLWQDGTYIGLPGIVLHVAQECSGIRSTWVLFITSLLASYLLLQTGWRRGALIALVIPLGILRNALRIVVIGLLCVNIGPHMIDSVIHRRGGPVFFAVSLVPLFLTAAWLHRQERREATRSKD